MTAPLYPLFVNLQGRTCVVVGGDAMAEAKARDLLAAGARVRLISPVVTPEISVWSQTGKLRWEPRSYEGGDLENAFLAVPCAGTAVNAEVFAESEKRHIFCNAVDDIENCSCYASAVVRRGPLQIAISTAGKSPALAQRLRKEFEEQFGPDYEAWVERLGKLRSALFEDGGMDRDTRRRLLHEQASTSAFEEFRRSMRKEGERQAAPDDCGDSIDSCSRGT